jgi:hypothetical protein
MRKVAAEMSFALHPSYKLAYVKRRGWVSFLE